jgi:uridine phosphorylase
MTESFYKNTDLIINPDGSIYHLHLKPGQVAPYVIIVGDPERVGLISSHFDSIEFTVQNRELLTHCGYLGDKRVMVLSTGMGTDNIDIIVHELDALVNIDISTRTRNREHTRLTILRIGTSGAIQPDVPLNTFVMSEYAIGTDGLLYYYRDAANVLEYELAEAFQKHTHWPKRLPRPYASRGSEWLLSRLDAGFLKGMTLTAPGFYGPQGRSVRLSLAYPELNDRIASFSFRGRTITNYEMETSALYGLCTMLGHEALTVCAAIANRATNQYDPGYKSKVSQLVELLMDRLRQF